ncbi:2-oxoglutarate dehydrogenase E1 component mitochondrial [Mycena indigotica]|uniref:2-oxoglutarate dehydrogenase E1 component mitochondrial n=1 Tax=Mycena indigotica TaxID=2126181 RepID=A0A8H6VYK6_9AGAR|nr:2-oxoglutarate dehydrogenase E1 component mitochondrial [Mycena indigotica]KAF7298919.1 2-oxoglutarate dehydrogenase E1 component mitochondrial [Mycena indigotica]
MRRQQALRRIFPRKELSKLRHVVAKLGRRLYHDESFGYRKPREFEFPDYTPAQLKNRQVSLLTLKHGLTLLQRAENAALLRYVDSIRTHGHRAARIDPLDLIQREEVAALDPRRYGLLDDTKKYNVNGIVWTSPVGITHREDVEEWWTLGQVTEHLRDIYTGPIAYEFMHSSNKTERLWFAHALESKHLASTQTPLPLEAKERIHGLLARSEVFDNFLQLKFPNLKRYGLEGGESMLPALDSLFSVAAQAGLSSIIIGMPHRGRLNFLTDLLQYSATALFHKIKGGAEVPEDLGAEGDVLSHLAASPNLQYDGALNPIQVSLLPNPSHLEAINPVAMGKTRAKQYSLLKTSPDDCSLGDKVMCVQLHGDASFSGQGVVMEALGMSNLPHFTSGGSVHIVVDNNIGYTTPATGARSSLYCSDVGKMTSAPVLHCNGDHPEDVVRAMQLAFQYREHNELDLPNLTSPLMYEKISSRRSVPQLYEERLMAEGVLDPIKIASVRNTYKAQLDEALARVPSYTPTAAMLQKQWSGMVWPASAAAEKNPDTGVQEHILKSVGKASVHMPENFEIHSKLQRHVKNRLTSIESGVGLDWSTAEANISMNLLGTIAYHRQALAFGSLMLEGHDIRISGQDVGRGTFSQRHAMLVNQKTEGVIVPLNETLGSSGKLELANSSLSEMAVLGFEYGASWERPNLLPIWEAQFGDFFNGAQIIIDTFISSSETKWLKQSGIVLLLPHGLDGAGPEHSSSRIERMLQLTNDRFIFDEANPSHDINMHVVFPTTPAQYFHLLRRQMKRNFRKPLIVAGPKALLRLSAASSSLRDLEQGTSFQPVLKDAAPNSASAKRVILMTGKIYYELLKERQARSLEDKVALIRIEELAPFPFVELRAVVEQYPQAQEFFWLQEEPRNQGAYIHVASRVESVLGGRQVFYRGRSESAVPAPGIGKLYSVQQKEVLASAFEGL